MEQEILFTEDQRFKQWWIWLIMLGSDFFFLFVVYQQLVMKEQVGDQPMSNTGVFIAIGILALVNILFFNTKLITRIQKDGVYVKFSPFHRSFKFYSWQEISRSQVRTYSPLKEYGGWGIRYSMGGNGMAYNISGNKGLQLELSNGKKILIGTAKPVELEAALAHLSF